MLKKLRYQVPEPTTTKTSCHHLFVDLTIEVSNFLDQLQNGLPKKVKVLYRVRMKLVQALIISVLKEKPVQI